MPQFWSNPSCRAILAVVAILAYCLSTLDARAEPRDERGAPAEAIAEQEPAAAVETRTLAGLDAEVAALIERGIQFRRERRDAEALESFRRAFDLAPSAKARAQIALAEQALGDWISAEQDLVLALEGADAWVETNRAHLESSLGVVRRHLAWLVVSTNVDGATLTLDGRDVGTITGTKMRVVSGAVSLSVEAAGFQPLKTTIVVEPGTVAHQELRLVPVAIQPVSPALVPARMSTSPEILSYSHGNDGDLAQDQRTAAWVLVAAAGLFLTEAIVAHVISEHRASQYNNDVQCVYGDLSRQERCGHFKDQAVLARALAIAGYGAAAGAGIAAGVLFDKASEPSQLSHSSGSSFGVSWRGKW